VCVELPVIMPFGFDQNGLNGGTSSKIFCIIMAGDTPVQIRWYKNDRAFEANDKKRVQMLDDTTSMLSLNKLDLEDSGTYTCRANNSAGLTQYSTFLRVKGTRECYIHNMLCYTVYSKFCVTI
jgi:hypothetical protein